MRAPHGMAALAAGWVLAGCMLVGCGTSDRDQVQAKVEQFSRAAASKDFKTICDQVLAPSLLAHLSAGGIGCEQAMHVALAAVRHPTLAIGRITIGHGRASVLVIASAYGQEASLEAIELVKTGGGWRISSLGAPVLSGRGMRAGAVRVGPPGGSAGCGDEPFSSPECETCAGSSPTESTAPIALNS